jgi:hypothetical protein
MSLIIPANTLASGGYEVANSLRFNSGSSDYLTRTPSSASNRRTCTVSLWVKQSILTGNRVFFDQEVNGSNFIRFYLDSNNRLAFYIEDSSAGGTQALLKPSALLRDVSAWYHFVIAVDVTQATESNRVKMYINGELQTSFNDSNYPSQNLDIEGLNTTNPVDIGRRTSNNDNLFNGYISEFCFIDGLALAADQFGEFDEDSGIWKPIDVSGLTFGTNGFYLDFEDSSALGNDVSGNTNNFTVNNLTAIDQSTDTCTNNFATWNPLWSQSNGNIGDVVFSEGNLKTTTSANYRTFPATIGFSSGKWYWEIKRYEDTADMHTGVMSELATPANTATWIGSTNNGWVFGCDGGSTYGDGVEGNTGYTAAPNAGDIVQVAFNADDGKIYFGVNGTWQNSGNPATGTNPAYTGLDTSLFYFPCASTGSDVEANFGSPSFAISSGNTDGNGYGNFEYAVPSGYYSLNTKNLSEYG